MNYVVLVLAIIFGVSGTLFTRASRGFKRLGYSLGAVAAFAASTVTLAWLLERLPVGIVYALWTGAAALVLLVVDAVVFDVKTNLLQRIGIAVTLCGVVMLSWAV